MKDFEEPFYRQVGNNLRKRRRLRNLTQQQLAEVVPYTFQQIHKYERAIQRISLYQLAKFAEVLDCTVGDFLEGTAFGRNFLEQKNWTLQNEINFLKKRIEEISHARDDSHKSPNRRPGPLPSDEEEGQSD